MKNIKTTRQMERHIKGIANHHRIGIILLVAESSGITLDQIVESLNANDRTIGEHVRRLCHAGLVNKTYRGRFVEHTLSPYGKIFVHFLKSFQKSNFI